ncbi:hypothetical protein BgiBS90_036808, partial [Biomphalaria glabrata]
MEITDYSLQAIIWCKRLFKAGFILILLIDLAKLGIFFTVQSQIGDQFETVGEAGEDAEAVVQPKPQAIDPVCWHAQASVVRANIPSSGRINTEEVVHVQRRLDSSGPDAR